METSITLTTTGGNFITNDKNFYNMNSNAVYAEFGDDYTDLNPQSVTRKRSTGSYTTKTGSSNNFASPVYTSYEITITMWLKSRKERENLMVEWFPRVNYFSIEKPSIISSSYSSGNVKPVFTKIARVKNVIYTENPYTNGIGVEMTIILYGRWRSQVVNSNSLEDWLRQPGLDVHNSYTWTSLVENVTSFPLSLPELCRVSKNGDDNPDNWFDLDRRFSHASYFGSENGYMTLSKNRIDKFTICIPYDITTSPQFEHNIKQPSGWFELLSFAEGGYHFSDMSSFKNYTGAKDYNYLIRDFI